VAELADSNDVRLKRRDGADLLLTRADRATSASEGAVTAARAFRNVLAHISPELLATSFVEEFPWVQVLPPEDVNAFARDFVRAAQASAELGQWAVLNQTVREWKATAAIYAEPGLAAKLAAPVTEDYGSAPAPVPTEE
jgi:hypothetical protein